MRNGEMLKVVDKLERLLTQVKEAIENYHRSAVKMVLEEDEA